MISAIAAFAFGQADVYLGDAVSANYVIDKNYLNNVQLADFSRLVVSDFGFVVNHDSQRLLRIINKVLDAIPVSERMLIMRRWSAGGQVFLGSTGFISAITSSAGSTSIRACA